MTVEAVIHQVLPSLADRQYAGIGFNGEFILSDADSLRNFYKMECTGKEYKETWKKELPDGIDCYSSKGISNNGTIFLRRRRADKRETVCYDKYLNELTVLHHKGGLIDCINEELFYQQGTKRHTWNDIDDSDNDYGTKYDFEIFVYKTDLKGGFLSSVLRKLRLGQRCVTLRPPLHVDLGW